ncbi:WD40-repeat-containing domain protein [Pestalotiopsis sp. NC0098]|nr:WD40-repeat-containing domain protein [Pestalotiopsis sp. NC0098]
MQKGSSADHFFETDASAQRRERQAAKSANKNGNPVALKSKPLGAILDVTSPSSLLVAESSGTVRRVNTETQDTKQVYRGPTAPVTCVAVGGPGNQTLFAGSWDKDIWSWDATSKAPGRKFSGHSDFVKAVVCTKLGDKHILISGGADKKIIVWDVATGSRLHVLQDQTVSMMAVQHLVLDPISSGPDEAILISAGSDPHIRRWRIRLDSAEQIIETLPNESEARHTILEHETTVYRLFFDQQGDEVDLWTASGDGTAKCLSRARNYAVEDTIEHGDHVRAIVTTEHWVVTGGRDEDIKVWDRASGKLYCTLEGHYDEVTDLIVLGNLATSTAQIASVSLDGTIRTWSLDKKELDKINQEKKDQANGVEKEAQVEEKEGLMTAEEEAELAALLEDDDE